MKVQKITIDKGAVSRAIRKHFEARKKAEDSGESGESSDWLPTWEEDEDLAKAIYKSKYASDHLDWFYVLQLISVVIDHYYPLKPEEFAEKLEEIINETAWQRDYLAIFPLAFREPFRFPRMKSSLVRPVIIGEFTFSPAASSVKAINKITAKYKYPPINESDFGHAVRTSQNALSNQILVTFNAHGAEDALRFSAESKLVFLRRLIEVFATLFGDTAPSLGRTGTANHFFLLNKTTAELRRLPTSRPSSCDFELTADLLKSIKRPEFNSFFTSIFTSKESMYGRMRNAIKFFTMAFNADDAVTSFLCYVISIESIFSRDKNAPIKSTLSDLASILCFPPEQRLDAYQIIRDVYDLRSSIVHSGASSVETKNVVAARSIAARAIYCSLLLCKDLKEGQGKLEDRFFNHLRDRKLGVVKAITPRTIWSLPTIDATDIGGG